MPAPHAPLRTPDVPEFAVIPTIHGAPAYRWALTIPGGPTVTSCVSFVYRSHAHADAAMVRAAAARAVIVDRPSPMAVGAG